MKFKLTISEIKELKKKFPLFPEIIYEQKDEIIIAKTMARKKFNGIYYLFPLKNVGKTKEAVKSETERHYDLLQKYGTISSPDSIAVTKGREKQYVDDNQD